MENQKQLNNLESLTSINISDGSVLNDTFLITKDSYSIHRCPKCGKPMKVDLSKVLASLPPKYEAVCTECKYVEYIRGNEVVYTIDNTPQTLPYRPNYLQADLCNHIFDIKLVNGNYVTYCTKCGKIGDSSQAQMPNFTNTPGVINHLDTIPCIDPLRFTCVEGNLTTSVTTLDEAKKVTAHANNTIGVVDKIYAGSTSDVK